MRHTWTRLVAVVAFAWLLTSLATSAATKPWPLEATDRGLTYGDWMARWSPDCVATLEAGPDPFAIVTGAYGEGMVAVGAAMLPGLCCRPEGGA